MMKVTYGKGSLNLQQVIWLRRLDQLVQHCTKCELYTGGRAKPFWTKRSKYAIIGEAPWTEEVEENEPFVGATGKLLWSKLAEFNFKKEDFLIVNSTNCKPALNRLKKPTTAQVGICAKWNELYLKIVRPKKILVLGNYAMGSVLGDFEGITGKVGFVEYLNKIPVVLCVHPSYVIYNREIGEGLFNSGVKIFKNLK